MDYFRIFNLSAGHPRATESSVMTEEIFIAYRVC